MAGEWDERFLSTTRGRIVGLLRRGPATVNDLAAAVQLTDNGVRAHLTSLERDGLVRVVGQQAGTRKPHTAYGLTEEAEGLFARHYGRLLSMLLDVLPDSTSRGAIEQALRAVGRRLGQANAPGLSGQSLRERAEKVVEVLGGLGGIAEVQEEGGRLAIQGLGCPLGELVRNHPEACRLAEALVGEILGVPVRECCQKSPRPRCRFEVETS